MFKNILPLYTQQNKVFSSNSRFFVVLLCSTASKFVCSHHHNVINFFFLIYLCKKFISQKLLKYHNYSSFAHALITYGFNFFLIVLTEFYVFCFSPNLPKETNFFFFCKQFCKIANYNGAYLSRLLYRDIQFCCPPSL